MAGVAMIVPVAGPTTQPVRNRVANDDHGHVALPKLYGAPAYARPPAQPVQRTERPFDPDELPLESARTEEERELALEIGVDEVPATMAAPADSSSRPMLRGRPFSLKAITGRLMGDETRTDA